jgi:hypothetical protein
MKKPTGPLQRLYDQAEASAAQEPLVNTYAEQHGDYDRNLRFVINRGGTTVDRWIKSGDLTMNQQAAINHVQGLWNVIGSTARLVANLDRTVFGSPGEGHIREIEAREDLARFKALFGSYWDVFENVCRFDMAAGVAGRTVRSGDRASTAALAIVKLIADMIYTHERLSY